MSAGYAFKQSLHICSVSILRIFLVFQLWTFKVGFSGPRDSSRLTFLVVGFFNNFKLCSNNSAG